MLGLQQLVLVEPFLKGLRFNRTMLGLQLFSHRYLPQVFRFGFNRTMLGLQLFASNVHLKLFLSFQSHYVRITTSWVDQGFRISLPRFNRTMLGLQHFLTITIFSEAFSFNRTMLGLQQSELLSKIFAHHHGFNRTMLGLQLA